MRKKPYEDEVTRQAKAARRFRSRQIREGAVEGLLERGTRTIRPDIRELIDAALEQRRRESPSDAENRATDNN
jgi:hypothetical protein